MRKFGNICFWLLFILFLEIVIKIALFNNVINVSIIYMTAFIIPISLLFVIITSLFGHLANKIISYVLISGITIIFIAQLVYYKTYLSIFSIYSMGKAGQIAEFADTILEIILHNIVYISIMLFPLIIFIIFNKKIINYDRLKLKNTVIYLLFFVVFQVLGNALLFVSKDEYYSVRELYYDTHSPTLSANKLGLLTTMRLDFKRTLTGFKEKSKLSTTPTNDDDDEEKPVEYNVMEIDFDKLIAAEKNQTINDMHTYFKNITPSAKNEYTGMFKGKNLIVLMGESFNLLAINKDITPTLYKLYNEGFKFTNFYTPVFPVSTTDGEYIMATSLIPKEGVWSAYRSSDNYFPFVLGNAFKNLDYKTTAYHNHSATYYERDEYIPNWGYDFYACKRGLNINCNRWPESDLEMIDASYNQYINNTPFMTYYITVSGHLNYTKAGNSMANKNWSYVKDLPYSEKPKGYLATHVELDKALESLIKHLDEAGILADTVIAMGGDHYPYGLTLDEINELADPDRDDNFEKHRSAFILWNSEMKPKTINKVGCSLDIVPTLLNLFGVEYDSRLLMGRDLLSDADPLVIYSNRSWITDKGRYNSITGTFEANKGVKVDSNYVKNINQQIYDKFYLSRQIIETDYYRKVFPK